MRLNRPLCLLVLLAGGVLAHPLFAQYDIAFTPIAGAASVGSADGPGSTARFNDPVGLFVDGDGSVLIADNGNSTVRRLAGDGTVSTIAGVPGMEGNIDGTLGNARFNGPTDIVRDSHGNLFVADFYAVRKIAPDGTVSTFAGWPLVINGNEFVPLFDGTSNIAIDSTDHVYVAGFLGLANFGLASFAPDATEFVYSTPTNFWPWGVAIDNSDRPYVSVIVPSSSNGEIDWLDASGNPTLVSDGEPDGPKFAGSTGITFGPDGTLYVADSGNDLIRLVATDGTATSLAGALGDPGLLDGNGAAAQFQGPSDVAVDAAGNAFVADSGNNAIRRVTPAGDVTTVAGLYPASAGAIDGLGSDARFHMPTGLAVGPMGEVYVADTGNSTIRIIAPRGAVSTLAHTASPPHWLAVDDGGNVYASEENRVIEKISPGGTITRFAGAPGGSITADGKADNWTPAGLAFDHHGNLFVADDSTDGIREISPTGMITTVALSASYGTPLITPMGIAVDADDNLFVVSQGVLDPTDNRMHAFVSKITPTGAVTLVAGDPGSTPNGSPSDGDPANAVPTGVAVDKTGAVYVTGLSGLFRFGPDGTKAKANATVSDPGSHNSFGKLTGIAIDASGNIFISDSLENVNVVLKGATAGHAPRFTVQPQGQTVAAGQAAQFSVTVDAVPAPVYQWYHGGSAIASASNATLSLTSVTSADAGDYTVVAHNIWGDATSAKATLAVTAATSTPPTNPTGGGGGSASGTGGGGAIGGWFVAALGLLSFAAANGSRARKRRAH
ncbi:MAG TPA: immunoglobulin domain-containing protein [Candidatus Didemnitutus sp.]|jgi:sugar lactone lactonase YvrE